MKVGILTFHRAQNFGAMLQAHALQKVIESLGNECEIIDYRCIKLEESYKNFIVPNKSLKGVMSGIIHFPNRYRRAKKFGRFSKKYYKLTKQAYTPDTISDAGDKFDACVVGSDQVWNPNITDSDLNYFLDFVSNQKRKISYAASLGVSDFDENLERYLNKNLKTFKKISVREDSAVPMLHRIAGITPEVVLDPVFLVDVTYWESLAKIGEDAIPGKYVFLYELHEHMTREYAEKVAYEKGMEVLLIPNDLRGGIRGVKKYAPTVENFLQYIKNAEFVVTDSFHVVAFSIIFQKQFAVLLKREQKNLNTRLVSLLDKLDLDTRIVEDISDVEAISAPIDYNKTKLKLEKLREKSMAFLEGALE